MISKFNAWPQEPPLTENNSDLPSASRQRLDFPDLLAEAHLFHATLALPTASRGSLGERLTVCLASLFLSLRMSQAPLCLSSLPY